MVIGMGLFEILNGVGCKCQFDGILLTFGVSETS